MKEVLVVHQRPIEADIMRWLDTNFPREEWHQVLTTPDIVRTDPRCLVDDSEVSGRDPRFDIAIFVDVSPLGLCGPLIMAGISIGWVTHPPNVMQGEF